MHHAALSVLLAAAVAAGCLAAPAGPDDEPGTVGGGDNLRDPRVPASAADARVVVAVIDTGINVYHDIFQRPGGLPDDVLDQFSNSMDGLAPISVVTGKAGEYHDRVAADEAVWESLQAETLYYFEGTNVLGISFNRGGQNSFPILDEPNSHGTGTAGAVLEANPNAIIVLVEGLGTDSEAWAAKQDWIDVVSMSYGPAAGVPGVVFGLTTHQATRLMWGSGKIPVGAADNTPSLAPHDETAGPPWVVGVAGDHEATKCRDHISGTFPDVTSDFTQSLPLHNHTTDNRSMSGTSFATPRTAGVFSAIVLDVRQALGHAGGIRDGALATAADGRVFANADVRSAVNRTAYYFDFADCQRGGTTQVPVNPAAPWLQMGWGHVGPDIVPTAVDHLLGLSTAAGKPDAAVTFMEGLHSYRQQYWQMQ